MSDKIAIFSKDKISQSLFEAFHNFLEKDITAEYFLLDDISLVFTGHTAHTFFKDRAFSFSDYALFLFRPIMKNLEMYSALLALYPDLPLVQRVNTLNFYNKLIQCAAFTRDGIPIPATVYVHSNGNTVYKQFIEQHIAFPLVMKDCNGSLGNLCFRLNTMEKVVAVMEEHPDTRFLLQRYIPNDFDYRLLVIDGRVEAVIQRVRNQANGEWRNNTSKGAARNQVVVEEVDMKIREVAIQAVKSLNLQLGGVDIIQDKETGKIYVLEVNASLQLKPGIAEAFVGYVNRRIRHRA